ncbi:cytochrome c oxidase subunit 7C [Megalopta genalis]|uniref:cytochrome c oxidase subunit 7C n=1 Tax=Megalopta genalis TaxID=115081 RepID=UPI003FD06DA9
MISQQLRRAFTTSARRMYHGGEGYPSSNLPFNVRNRFVLTGTFMLFFGSGFSTPYLILRYQMLK